MTTVERLTWTDNDLVFSGKQEHGKLYVETLEFTDWEEAKHPRNHGKFAKVEGDEGTDEANPKAGVVSKGLVAKPGEGTTGTFYQGDPTCVDQARIGVPADEVPPPPKVPRLPNLTPGERTVETRFADAYEKDPDGMAKAYLAKVAKGEVGDGPNTFSTDDAKTMSPDYNPPGASDDENKKARAAYNVATFQTADALAKRAFQMRLDELAKLPKDDPQRTVLVTNGGCAAGKGYAAGKLGSSVGATWDSAGETNGIENAWVAKELESRGLRGNFLFVHQDATAAWAGERGVIARAGKIGRIVDARLYADSYGHGPKNFQKFMDEYGSKPHVSITVIDNSKGATPVPLDRMPREALRYDAETLYRNALGKLDEQKATIPTHLLAAAQTGVRIWGSPTVAGR